MSHIAQQISSIAGELPEGVKLVAVSKFHPAEAVIEAYRAGQRLFGESRATELKAKATTLPSDIEWHFIGHLQTNKVRQVVAYCHMIQSVDSLRLLEAIATEAARQQRQIDILLQLHVAREETKYGFLPDELMELIPDIMAHLGPWVRVRGVMGMATNTDDDTIVRSDFRTIRRTFDRLAAGPFASTPEFNTVSMGMSHDRNIAVEEGSTMIRVGTDIFGERQY